MASRLGMILPACLASGVFLPVAVASGTASSSGDAPECNDADNATRSLLGNYTLETWCKQQSQVAFLDHLVSNEGLSQDDAASKLESCCDKVCRNPDLTDHRDTCESHAFHDYYSTWKEDLEFRTEMQWNVFFVALSLLFGALFGKILPESIPFTVGILLVFFLLGIGAQRLVASDCPVLVWQKATAANAQHLGVSREQWNEFIGFGLHNGSFCLTHTCGDGTSDPPGCRWTFEGLNRPFTMSYMRVEKTRATVEPDDYLSADELWTPSCNLLKDMLGLAEIDPHQLLVIFLPALLFESACFGIDMGLFFKQKLSIIILAFPAMLLASVITGLLIWSAFQDWTFWVCWLIGVIQSATDPVAVVALLKELGASKALGTLIEGESLLNDGSAVVLFTWVRNVIGYTSSTQPPTWMQAVDADGEQRRYAGEIGVELLRVMAQMLFFGIFFGLFFGFATRVMCRYVYNQLYIEGPVVLAMSYLCFWLAELICGTSAVLAVVIMGLYINQNRSEISADVFHFLHEFYSMAAYILNTVIFAIAGAKLGLLVADEFSVQLWRIFTGRVMMIYPVVLLSRGVAIGVFFPLLKRVGMGCRWQDAVIMWWGGLRGSVGLALALIIQHTTYDETMWGTDYHYEGSTKSLDCRDQPSMVVAMTVVVVAMTVVVNGITMAPLMKLLGMTEATPSRKMMLNGSYSKLRQKTSHCIAKLKSEETFFRGVDWGSIQDLAGAMDLTKFEELHEKDVAKAAWLSVLSIERASYLRQFEDGLLTKEAFATLEHLMATITAKAAEKAVGKLEKLYSETFSEEIDRLLHPRGGMRLSHRVLNYQVAKSYMVGQIDVKHCMSLYRLTAGEIKATASAARAEAAKRAAAEMSNVETSHSGTLDKMRLLLRSADESGVKDKKEFADYKSRYAAELLLIEQREVVEHLRHEGLLDELDAMPLTSVLNKRIEGIMLLPLFEWLKRMRTQLLVGVGRALPPVGRHFHLHELERGQSEAQVTLEMAGVRLAGMRSPHGSDRKLSDKPAGDTSPKSAKAIALPTSDSGKLKGTRRQSDPLGLTAATQGLTAATHAAAEKLEQSGPRLPTPPINDASRRRRAHVPPADLPHASSDWGPARRGAGATERSLSRVQTVGQLVVPRLQVGALGDSISRLSNKFMPGAFPKNLSFRSSRSNDLSTLVEPESSLYPDTTPRRLVDIDATEARIRELAAAVGDAQSAAQTLLHAGETFGSDWLDALRSVGADCAEVGSSLDLVIIGDYGRDQDDEKALAMAVAMRRLGLVGDLTVIANVGDSMMRARLAKGTVSVLGAHDVRVAAGSKLKCEQAEPYPFADCPYLAAEDEIESIGGHELALQAIRDSRDAGHKLAFVLGSALTDMAAILEDPRWEELAPGVVSHVCHMGGVVDSANGELQMAPDANNNSIDRASAGKVYDIMREDKRFWFIVVTRHAAGACVLPRTSFDGSAHPMARRLSEVAKPGLQKLWMRVHATEVERMIAHDSLPMNRDVEWFRRSFLEPGAPHALRQNDDIWPWVRGFMEYDGLTMVVAATVTHAELFTLFFQPYVNPNSFTLVLGWNANQHGILDGRKVSELLHYLMAVSMGPGSGEWFGRLSRHEQGSDNHTDTSDMLMVGDFGNSPDGEKGLIMAVAMRRIGLVGELTVVTNLGDARMRGRLAKGTLNALGAQEVRVGVGSDGGRAGEAIHEYEFEACPYLAPETELDERGGHELAFAAIRGAREHRRKLTIVLFSALTDMAALLRDPRWAELAPGVVSHVVIMGGLLESADGRLRMDPDATNNTYDRKNADFVYEQLETDDGAGKGIQLVVVTRHAAGAVRLPKKALDGSSHPTALRLTAAEQLSLQKLWSRVHQSEKERLSAKDGLPLRCDPEWFRSKFLEPSAPASLGAEDDVWPYVKGLTEYDSLTTLVAATATTPELFKLFFQPYHCKVNRNTLLIGRGPADLGISDPEKASELLHDLIVTAFQESARFKKGFKIEIRSSPLSNRWQLAMLDKPARGQGMDGWVATVTDGADEVNAAVHRIPVYLTNVTEGILWRLAHQLGDTEPILPDLRLGVRYRVVKGLRASPWYVTQGGWECLRAGLAPQRGDVWVTGYQSSGNSLVQFLVRTLLHGGSADAASKSRFASGITSALEVDLALGKVDLDYLAALPPPSRVFTSYHLPANLPCRYEPTKAQLLPEGVKVIHPIRDPHDSCVSMYNQLQTEDDAVFRHWDLWAHAFADGKRVPWGGWLAQNRAWWDAKKQHPKQVLWITFEECKEDASAAVRKVAAFLELTPSEEVVARTAEAVNFEVMKTYLERHPKLRRGTSSSLGGSQLNSFSRNQLHRIHSRLVQPAREYGIEFKSSSAAQREAAPSTARERSSSACPAQSNVSSAPRPIESRSENPGASSLPAAVKVADAGSSSAPPHQPSTDQAPKDNQAPKAPAVSFKAPRPDADGAAPPRLAKNEHESNTSIQRSQSAGSNASGRASTSPRGRRSGRATLHRAAESALRGWTTMKALGRT